jgi:hypothetical protein
MNHNDIFDEANRRADLRSQIIENARRLAGGDPKIASQLLAELAIELRKEAEKPIAEAQAAERHGAPRRVSPPSTGAVRRGGSVKHGNRTESLLADLAAHPRGPIADIAERVYGSREPDMQGRVRSLMAALKKRKQIKRVGPGQWEVAS